MIGTVGSTAEKSASYLRGNAAVETLGVAVSKCLDAVPEFFFYCIAELAVKPCRSSRSNNNTRGGFEKIP